MGKVGSFLGDDSSKLLPLQKRALRDLSSQESGVLVAPPGSGKTVIACALIAKRKLRTLVLVHRKQLADQWTEQLLQFTDLEKGQIGSFDGKETRRKGVVDMGMLQTLARDHDPDRLLDGYGHIVIDECHHVPAVSFESVLRRIQARHFLGLTATPYRKDGLEKIITMQCGPVLHTMAETKAQAQLSRQVLVRETGFRMDPEASAQPALHEIWQALITDKERLRLVASDVIAALEEERFPLVLSDRKDHLELLLAEITASRKHVAGFLFTSDIGKRQRNRMMDEITAMRERGEFPFLLSTGSLIGEGFDLPELCTLVLAMPLSFKGRLVQYAGRLHRESAGKRDVRIYDYVDSNLGLCITMFRKRMTTYRKMGYIVEIPPDSHLSEVVGRKPGRKTSVIEGVSRPPGTAETTQRRRKE
jgi:superfamily II DNA or RNA helicase